MSNQRRGHVPTPLLTIVIYDDPAGFEKASSAAAYASQCLQTAMLEFGRGHGTIMSGDMVGQNASGQTNVSLGNWQFTPGPDLPP
jgi:hypothetical protein